LRKFFHAEGKELLCWCSIQAIIIVDSLSRILIMTIKTAGSSNTGVLERKIPSQAVYWLHQHLRKEMFSTCPHDSPGMVVYYFR
jgi:hypothetical protein